MWLICKIGILFVPLQQIYNQHIISLNIKLQFCIT